MATGKRYYWIKLKDSFMTSDSVDYVMSQPNGSEYVVIYQMLCLKTINTNGRLARKIGDVVIPYDARKLSRDLKFFKAETIQKAIDIFRSLGLIYDDNGILAMTDHENLVGCETDWSGQKRRQRDTPDGQTGGQAEDTSVDNARTDRGQSCGQNFENVHTDIRDKEKDIDIRDKEIIKRVLKLAKKHGTKVYGLVSNMNIAVQRRDFLQHFDCFICNQLEAGQLFVDDYSYKTPEEMRDILADKIERANIPSMVVTMGGQGAVYADRKGNKGICPAKKVMVKDTTGAGDAFCSGVVIGLTYGKSMAEAIEIGSTLAASVIVSSDNVCPRFLPEEFGIEFSV